MISRINRYKSRISTVFLLGYITFILISTTHFHKEIFYGGEKTIDNVSNSTTSKTSGQNEENCPICQLSTSLNINVTSLTLTSGLVLETIVFLNNETVFTTSIVHVNSLRGPPSFNI
ncbi:MAG: hypothetical protein P4L35_07895 [Ignavibacteriaceae bacterium]|nr:hypothetical protein [Ignavibacteriaceae bacterium]